MPVDFGLKVVAAGLRGSDFAPDGLDAGDAPAQALAHHDIDLKFCHVQPAAVLRGIDELEAVPQCLGFLEGKRLVQRGQGMGVQVVHHQRDALGVGIVCVLNATLMSCKLFGVFAMTRDATLGTSIEYSLFNCETPSTGMLVKAAISALVSFGV